MRWTNHWVKTGSDTSDLIHWEQSLKTPVAGGFWSWHWVEQVRDETDVEERAYGRAHLLSAEQLGFCPCWLQDPVWPDPCFFRTSVNIGEIARFLHAGSAFWFSKSSRGHAEHVCESQTTSNTLWFRLFVCFAQCVVLVPVRVLHFTVLIFSHKRW